jgi:type II secretory pathway pseudopilin PulG
VGWRNQKKTMDAGKRAANEYVKYKAKFMATNLFLLAGTIGAVGLLFICFITARQKKDDRTRADLQAIAQAAISYRVENDAFPNSIDQLGAFVINLSGSNTDRLPSRDPWKQGYYYMKISGDRVAVASSGSNRTLDTSPVTLSKPPEDCVHNISGDEIWIFKAPNDDWIFLAGSWPPKKENRQQDTGN